MAIASILLMGDVDSVPVIEVGAIVVPIDDLDEGSLDIPRMYKQYTNGRYHHAIVISMSPFTLASEDGRMRWQSTLNQNLFEAIGKATPEVVAVAMTRLNA